VTQALGVKVGPDAPNNFLSRCLGSRCGRRQSELRRGLRAGRSHATRETLKEKLCSPFKGAVTKWLLKEKLEVVN
jgi:hypothetical protein